MYEYVCIATPQSDSRIYPQSSTSDLPMMMSIMFVPDRRRRILLKVVLVRRWVTWVLGIWRGEGLGRGLG